MSTSRPALFTPIRVGNCDLSHRLVLAPLTRYRANKAHVHNRIAATYYAQRGAEAGTLLISEATFIAQQAGGYRHVPGIWSDEQIAAWKLVTEAVHAKGSYIFLQLWALGRAADPAVLAEEDPNIPYISSSNIQLTNKPIPPRPLTVSEIKEFVQLYAKAAANAVHLAGFDGVEVHGANGYLVDQFTQVNCNNRTDEYGGSIEKRSRFALEVLHAVSEAVGQERTAIRLSPWGEFNDMRGLHDPRPQFSYLLREIVNRFPKLAFVDVVEPRAQGGGDRTARPGESNDFIREIWNPRERTLVTAGAYTRQTALDVAEKSGELISFGRHWISNPDLPRRLRDNIPLTPYDRSTFYLLEDPRGYIDYPTADEQKDVTASL